jgi:ABC-type multidrug transport system ATPase subunit
VEYWHGDGNWALRGVSLAVGSEIYGLLGPNGAGKSTFFSVVLGVLTPQNGQVRTHGRVSICPQFDVVWGELTVL